MMKTTVWIDIDAKKMPNLWEAIWNELARIEGDKVCENRGEVWQYMGSRLTGKKVTHYFRHRDHPETHQTKRIEIKTEI